MSARWHEYSFSVGMPHMAPGGRLSEVELLKVLGDQQWAAIAAALRRPAGRIENELGERLYASFIDIEFDLGRHCAESLGEDKTLTVRNSLRTYAQRFAEGLFVFDDAAVPENLLASLKTQDDLAGLEHPWAYITNAFIARAGSNTALAIYKPVGIDEAEGPTLEQAPPGITEQRRVLSSGEIDPFPAAGDARAVPFSDRRPVTYDIVPESDLNGAGLLYFARFVAIANYGERRFLGERLERPWSSPLCACLSPRRRRIYYFGNANPHDAVHVHVSAGVVPRDGKGPVTELGPFRRPLDLRTRIDLYRASDRVLIASTLAEKALHVPAKERALQHEAERFLRALA